MRMKDEWWKETVMRVRATVTTTLAWGLKPHPLGQCNRFIKHAFRHAQVIDPAQKHLLLGTKDMHRVENIAVAIPASNLCSTLQI